MRRRLPSPLLAVFAVLLAGCGAPWARRSDEANGEPPPVAFLRSPRASLGEAVRELGPPSRQFVRDRVSMWDLASDGERLQPVRSAPHGERVDEFTLVVAFDEQGEVAQWSLVRLYVPPAGG
ncbi:MAG: hypothetical protein JNL12_15365 [Planctomycetes bacterium]|nr:hypothetical protein [Planctomycetota bacterium]